jgi:hypothetical protein
VANSFERGAYLKVGVRGAIEGAKGDGVLKVAGECVDCIVVGITVHDVVIYCRKNGMFLRIYLLRSVAGAIARSRIIIVHSVSFVRVDGVGARGQLVHGVSFVRVVAACWVGRTGRWTGRGTREAAQENDSAVNVANGVHVGDGMDEVAGIATGAGKGDAGRQLETSSRATGRARCKLPAVERAGGEVGADGVAHFALDGDGGDACSANVRGGQRVKLASGAIEGGETLAVSLDTATNQQRDGDVVRVLVWLEFEGGVGGKTGDTLEGGDGRVDGAVGCERHGFRHGEN